MFVLHLNTDSSLQKLVNKRRVLSSHKEIMESGLFISN